MPKKAARTSSQPAEEFEDAQSAKLVTLGRQDLTDLIEKAAEKAAAGAAAAAKAELENTMIDLVGSRLALPGAGAPAGVPAVGPAAARRPSRIIIFEVF